MDWLDIASTSGSLAPGESTSVAVTVDRGGLAAGGYAAALVVDGGPADNSPLQVQVSLLVTDLPPLFLPGLRR